MLAPTFLNASTVAASLSHTPSKHESRVLTLPPPLPRRMSLLCNNQCSSTPEVAKSKIPSPPATAVVPVPQDCCSCLRASRDSVFVASFPSPEYPSHLPKDISQPPFVSRQCKMHVRGQSQAQQRPGRIRPPVRPLLKCILYISTHQPPIHASPLSCRGSAIPRTTNRENRMLVAREDAVQAP